MLGKTLLLLLLGASIAQAQIGPTPDWAASPPAEQPAELRDELVAPSHEKPENIREAAPVDTPTGIESRPLGAAPTGVAPDGSEPLSGTGLISGTVLPLLAVLGLVVALAALARAVMRGRGGLVGALGAGGRAPSGVLEVLGRYPVARGSTLVLLKLDRRVLLLAQSRASKLGGASFTTLSEITDPEEVAALLLKTRDDAEESMSKRFSSLLGAFERQQPAVDVAPTSARAPGSAPLETRAHAPHNAISSVRRRLDELRSEGSA